MQFARNIVIKLRRVQHGQASIPAAARVTCFAVTRNLQFAFYPCSHVYSQEVMLIDSSLWPPLHQAKDALFTALLNRCQEPPARVFSAPPSQRHAIRTQTNEKISALLELERELEAIQREFKQAYEMISQQRAAAELCLWPIGALPFDVIREIALYTVEGRHDHRQILDLSHVSKQWREAVLSISWLFTEANWDEWSPLWIDTWCSWAGPRLLKVYLRRSLRSDLELGGAPNLLVSRSCRSCPHKWANSKLSCHRVPARQ